MENQDIVEDLPMNKYVKKLNTKQVQELETSILYYPLNKNNIKNE